MLEIRNLRSLLGYRGRPYFHGGQKQPNSCLFSVVPSRSSGTRYSIGNAEDDVFSDRNRASPYVTQNLEPETAVESQEFFRTSVMSCHAGSGSQLSAAVLKAKDKNTRLRVVHPVCFLYLMWMLESFACYAAADSTSVNAQRGATSG